MNPRSLTSALSVVCGSAIAALPLIYHWHLSLAILATIRAAGEGNARVEAMPDTYLWAMFALGAAIALAGVLGLFKKPDIRT